VDAVEPHGGIREVQPRKGLVGWDTALPERPWAYADGA
jgi:hypothetical protein